MALIFGKVYLNLLALNWELVPDLNFRVLVVSVFDVRVWIIFG